MVLGPALVGAFVGCAGSTASGGGGGSQSAEFAPGQGTVEESDAWDTGCRGIESGVSADDLAMTPRENERAELVALCLEGGYVATEEAYGRVGADLAAIEATVPEVASIPTLYGGREVVLAVPEWLGGPVAEGEYPPVECLNQVYGLQSVEADYDIVTLSLEGTYNLPLVAKDYAALPLVLEAFGVTTSVSDGPTITGARVGEEYHYVFDDRRGDCPSGCTEGTAYYFVTSSAGAISEQEKFEWGDSAGWPAAPEWYVEFGSCHYL